MTLFTSKWKKNLMQICNNFWIILFDFVVIKLFYNMKFS